MFLAFSSASRVSFATLAASLAVASCGGKVFVASSTGSSTGIGGAGGDVTVTTVVSSVSVGGAGGEGGSVVVSVGTFDTSVVSTGDFNSSVGDVNPVGTAVTDATSVSSGLSETATSSTGPEMVCQQACDRLSQCGFTTGGDCQQQLCNDPSGPCYEKCILAYDCQDYGDQSSPFYSCVQSCDFQGTGGGAQVATASSGFGEGGSFSSVGGGFADGGFGGFGQGGAFADGGSFAGTGAFQAQSVTATTTTGPSATTNTAVASSGASSSSGTFFSCGQCTAQSCGNQLAKCYQNQDCQSWFGCIQNCGSSPECYHKCNATFPAAAPEYDNVYKCACNKCEGECESSVDACNQP